MCTVRMISRALYEQPQCVCPFLQSTSGILARDHAEFFSQSSSVSTAMVPKQKEVLPTGVCPLQLWSDRQVLRAITCAGWNWILRHCVYHRDSRAIVHPCLEGIHRGISIPLTQLANTGWHPFQTSIGSCECHRSVLVHSMMICRGYIMHTLQCKVLA